MNVVSSYLDASFVYGIDEERARELRTMKGGQLKSNAMNRHKGMKDLLPPKMKNPDAGCKRPNKDVFCFLAGKFAYNDSFTFFCFLIREKPHTYLSIGTSEGESIPLIQTFVLKMKLN